MSIIELNLDPQDELMQSKSDKELKKAFDLIFARKSNGTIDEEDVAFVVARREYLTDDQLKLITGKTRAELDKAPAPVLEEDEKTSDEPTEDEAPKKASKGKTK